VLDMSPLCVFDQEESSRLRDYITSKVGRGSIRSASDLYGFLKWSDEKIRRSSLECYGQRELLEALLDIGEPPLFAIEHDQIAPYLADFGFQVLETVSPAQLESLYLKRTDGSFVGRVAFFEHIVTAKKI